jgi:hypothetical protein
MPAENPLRRHFHSAAARSTAPPAAREAAAAWELVPAPHGRGRWLATIATGGVIAVAAPGVAFTGESREDLDRWRWARWERAAGPIDLAVPARVEPLPLHDVVALVDAEWHRWIEHVTCTLLRRRLAFASLPIGTRAHPDDDRAHAAQRAYAELLAEARVAFPDRASWPASEFGATAVPASAEQLLARVDARGPWRRSRGYRLPGPDVELGLRVRPPEPLLATPRRALARALATVRASVDARVRPARRT